MVSQIDLPHNALDADLDGKDSISHAAKQDATMFWKLYELRLKLACSEMSALGGCMQRECGAGFTVNFSGCQ